MNKLGQFVWPILRRKMRKLFTLPDGVLNKVVFIIESEISIYS